ncbi:MAG: response regulator [Armatimonadetes bacterium]|nr:response regulator [Armatimonadota bacterium]
MDWEPYRNSLALVDDDATYQLLLTSAFRKEGLETVLKALPDGRLAQQYLLEAPSPRLVLLDLNLPGLSGFELLRWIRTGSPNPRIPVLLHSHSVDREEVARAYELGANAFIPKPTSLRDLRDLARELASFWVVRNVLPARP